MSSAPVQDRGALKSVGLPAAMTAALIARGVPGPTAHLAAALDHPRTATASPG